MVRCPQIAITILASACLVDQSDAATRGETIQTWGIVVSLESPLSLHGKQSLGYAADFSGRPIALGAYSMYTPTGDPSGCSQYDLPHGNSAAVVVVQQGKCSAFEQAKRAQSAGAAGILVVSTAGAYVLPAQATMTKADMANEALKVPIFVVCVDHDFGNDLIPQIRTLQMSTPAQLSFSAYQPVSRGLGLALIVLLATLLVALGGYFSTLDLSKRFRMVVKGPPPPFMQVAQPVVPANGGRPPSGTMNLQAMHGLLFCGIGSCMLMLLYFFMSYLIYFLIFSFCVAGVAALTVVGGWVLQRIFPALGQGWFFLWPCGPVAYSDLVAAIAAVLIVLGWLLFQGTQYGWIFQDIIGAAFLLEVQHAVKLNSMQVATAVLMILFCFDIFWVFISPLLFKQSVMVKVATAPTKGWHVPMLLAAPSFCDPFGHGRMLGFGDVAAPGLFVAFLKRYDIWRGFRFFDGYFFPAVIGYLVGLLCAICAMYIMKMGQPALLYLVPGTLGLTALNAACRGGGELPSLWQGMPSDDNIFSVVEEEEAAMKHGHLELLPPGEGASGFQPAPGTALGQPPYLAGTLHTYPPVQVHTGTLHPYPPMQVHAAGGRWQ